MSPREQAVLDALRKDRDESGPGLSKVTVEEIGETRFADGLIIRLRRQRYVIGVVGDLYQLGDELAFTEALSSGEAAIIGEADLSRLREDQTGDSASVSAVQPLFELRPVSAIDPMLDEAA